VGTEHQHDLDVLGRAAMPMLLPLIRHASPMVRIGAALIIVTSHPDQLDTLRPLYADGATISQQTFDMVDTVTVAEMVVGLVCQMAKRDRYADALLGVSRDEAARAAVRSMALGCAAPTRPAAALLAARQALAHTGDPLAHGAISLVLTGWLEHEHLAPHALHNAQEPLVLEWRPTLAEVMPVARQASSPDAAVREIVGEAVAWLEYPELRDTVHALAADPAEGVRMITLRSYMQRAEWEPEIMKRCLADTNEFISGGCSDMIATTHEPARWIAWAVSERRMAKGGGKGAFDALLKTLRKTKRTK
jgi:hypothetical protein